MSFYQHRNSHCKDKTVSRPSSLYNGNPYPKRLSLYWNGALCVTTCGKSYCSTKVCPTTGNKNFHGVAWSCTYALEDVVTEDSHPKHVLNSNIREISFVCNLLLSFRVLCTILNRFDNWHGYYGRTRFRQPPPRTNPSHLIQHERNAWN